MYECNYTILQKIAEEKSILCHSTEQFKPDGTYDLEGNRNKWNTTIARFDQLFLWTNGAPGFDDRDPLQTQPSIIFIPAQNKKTKQGTIIIAHGGVFESRIGCEGIYPAEYFARSGFNTAILTYRLTPYSRMDAIHDMQRAIRLLRYRKDELHITDKIAVMGFSAGGMLSGNCATHFDYGNPASEDPVNRLSCRPDAAVLGYATIKSAVFPEGTFIDPFENRNQREKLYLAPEKNITCDTPPFFIWQTNSDDPRHAFVLGSALTEAGVPFELHCFPDGTHGMALADGNNNMDLNLPHVAHWADLCTEWLRGLGL